MKAIKLHRPNIHFLLIVTVAGLCIWSGCSGSPKSVDMGGEEGSKVAATVEDLNEVKNNAKKLANVFVANQKVPDAKELNKHTFYVMGKPIVQGSSATCKVQIEKADGTPVGEQQWEFEKVADAWKIKSAPLR